MSNSLQNELQNAYKKIEQLEKDLCHSEQMNENLTNQLVQIKEKYNHEIALRKKIKSKLYQNELKYKHIVECANEGVAIIQNEKFVYVNSYFASLMKYEVRELNKMKFIEIIHPDSRQSSQKIFSQNRSGDFNKSIFELIFRDKNGTKIYVEINIIPFEYRRRDCILVFIRDNSERNQTKEDLKLSERKYRTLYSSMSEGVSLHEIIFDDKGNAIDYLILEVNKAYEEILSLKREDVINRKASDVYNVPEPPYLKVFSHVASTGEHTSFEAFFEPMEKYFHISVFSPEHGKFASIFTDITRNKLAEKALHIAIHNLSQKKRQLEITNKELSELTWVVSHDLKEPLRAIYHYADFLLEDLEEHLSSDQKKYIFGLNKSVKQAKKLIDDLLQFTQVGRVALKYETIEMNTFIVNLLKSQNYASDIEIEISKDWPTIDTEPMLLKYIFINLINNAIKFNDNHPKCIKVGFKNISKNLIELYVKDNGIGIESRHLDQIFKVFHRLHHHDIYEGTGIGLAIVKKAVSRLHGSIRVHSQPLNGSTFYITLPRFKREFA